MAIGWNEEDMIEVRGWECEDIMSLLTLRGSDERTNKQTNDYLPCCRPNGHPRGHQRTLSSLVALSVVGAVSALGRHQ